jgi:hypothetical protein
MRHGQVMGIVTRAFEEPAARARALHLTESSFTWLTQLLWLRRQVTVENQIRDFPPAARTLQDHAVFSAVLHILARSGVHTQFVGSHVIGGVPGDSGFKVIERECGRPHWAVTPAFVKVLDRLPSPEQRLVWRHKDRIVLKHRCHCSCIPGHKSLEVGIGSVNDRWVFLFFWRFAGGEGGPKCGYGKHAEQREDEWK